MSEQSENSPAQRYAAFREAGRHPMLHEFAQGIGFDLDDFQRRACAELEDGRGVLVAAPTGSGKTVVGEFAVFLALAAGRKCFYTTPIKALSNQKYADLLERFGAEQVGLLTGDNSVNSGAPIVVMTTEVLRNMLYAGSGTLSGLAYVVMDEVHYLADRSRGAVWEEVIIHLPESVAVVSLSATVSNAEEFGEWLATVRGDTTTIVEERRPVPLFQHVLVGRRMHDLFSDEDAATSAGFANSEAKVNPDLMRIARDDWASSRIRDRRAPKGSRGGKNRGKHQGKGAGKGHAKGHEQARSGNGRRVWVPSRADVVAQLERAKLLPAIVFIFSRAGCDAAVAQCLDADVRLTSRAEQDEIRSYVETRCADLPQADRRALRYAEFLDALTRGVAAHHAGMLPTFKECVEELFLRGLCRVVFATETLALGINMPARTVVVEKLSKWNGETHADLTPGEYTQLTGRAGRRGLDVEGHAVVLWQPGMSPTDVAGLAATRTYPLRSSFRPSYNMAVNLIDAYGRERARHLLESSFAQFQADRSVVGLAQRLRKAEDALEGYAESVACDRGDFFAYARLQRRIDALTKQRGRREPEAAPAVVAALNALRPGDVIRVPVGKFAGYAVVVDPGVDDTEPRPLVVTHERQARRLGLRDFPTPVAALSRIRVPRNFDGRDPERRRELAQTLRHHVRSLDPTSPGTYLPAVGGSPEPRAATPDPASAQIEELRRELRAHPCHSCPHRAEHARWAGRWFDLDADAATLRRRIETRTNTVARRFDRVCDVLLALGYLSAGPGSDVEGPHVSGPEVSGPEVSSPEVVEADPGVADQAAGAAEVTQVTERGRLLMRIYSELDLVAAEALRLGLLADLAPDELAAALSALVFEARRNDDGRAGRFPSGAVGDAIIAFRRLWRDLSELEERHRLEPMREPDAGFAPIALGWARGEDLDDLLRDTALTAGDFVRVMKQLVDLTDQVAEATTDAALRRTARASRGLLARGVVAYSTVGSNPEIPVAGPTNASVSSPEVR